MRSATRNRVLGLTATLAAGAGACGAAAAATETQAFTDSGSASAVGWTAVDGDGSTNTNGGADIIAGFYATEVTKNDPPNAVADSGEGRLQGSRGALSYYADTSLGGELSFSSPFAASGRLDFADANGTDFGTGMALGYFDKDSSADTSINNLLLAGFNITEANPAALQLRLIYRVNGSFVVFQDSATSIANSVENDRSFTLSWNPTGGAQAGQGRMTGTVTDLSAGTTQTLTMDAFLTGNSGNNLGNARLDAFGLVKPGSGGVPAQNVDWRIDDVTYDVVPEPSAAGLLAAAGALLLPSRRRRG